MARMLTLDFSREQVRLMHRLATREVLVEADPTARGRLEAIVRETARALAFDEPRLHTSPPADPQRKTE